MLPHFINVQYCYTYLINQIPFGLLLYSHIPTALVAIVFSGYVALKAKNLRSIMLFATCLSFSIWCILDLTSWFAFLGAANVMFAWSLLDLFGLIMFFCAYYFLYLTATGHDMPIWQKVIGLGLIGPTGVWTFFGRNLTLFNANTCEAIENDLIAKYPYFVEGFIVLAVIALITYLYIKTRDVSKRREIVLAGTGVALFLGFFLSSTLGVNLLINDATVQYAYNYEIYGLFGMPILLIYLGYLIVRYHEFNLKIFGAQALILVLVTLVGSEFAFLSSVTNQILVAITLIFVGVVGILLTRSVRKEISQRVRIEKLATELELTNERQETLIHFISHEVKGFLTKDMGVLAALSEGDAGPLPASTKRFVDEGLNQSRSAVRSVTDLLTASNQKKGTISYAKAPFDLKDTVTASVAKARPTAENKGLTLSLAVDESASYMLNGDQAKIADNVLRNIIDNSINYTPSGSVAVSLKKEGDKLIFTVKDTGVGITEEDKKRLFTEGGHGKDSQKVNAHSTGYGLYIAKNIVEAHGGTIRAESEGEGKGSTFTVELPT